MSIHADGSIPVSFKPDDLPKTTTFSVDAELFRELGEHLVGQPHIALAELIKNSYDADATEVAIRFTEDRIVIADNGHGMDDTAFKNFWMRVGSRHKERDRFSPMLGRPMTGSKGIGRLAVQFLAKELTLVTVPSREYLKHLGESKEREELRAYVEWSEAIEAGELTNAVARYATKAPEAQFPGDSSHGTLISLSNLNHQWDKEKFAQLGGEIWWLQPPFEPNPDLDQDVRHAFNVEVKGPDDESIREFEEQVTAILDIWVAKLDGELGTSSTNRLKMDDENNRSSEDSVEIELEFSDGSTSHYVHTVENLLLYNVEFSIRIYHLRHRQPHGIRVGEARDYMNDHGGVHVYDAGFHLPYYGVEHDWLDTEIDHAHRKSQSQLLPNELHVQRGMNFLPTQSRILGVVHVNTAEEARLAHEHAQTEHLKIQLSRDRLVDNEAYRQLKNIVRAALDFYAMEQARRHFKELEKKKDVEEVHEKFERIDSVLEFYKDDIPDDIYEELESNIEEAIEASETEAEHRARQAGLLGSLATAGMSALAHEHEAHKQLDRLERLGDRIRNCDLDSPDGRRRVKDAAKEIAKWVKEARETRRLFSPLLEEENREEIVRLRARALVRDVTEQMRVVLRSVTVDVEAINPDLRLPKGRFVEWSSIFQNVFTNAVNAMLDSHERMLRVESDRDGEKCAVVVSDTGIGVNLDDAEGLFQPFERRLEISSERRRLGYGGTGLGLTIVKMLATKLDCRVRFISPKTGFNTSFEISWTEQ